MKEVATSTIVFCSLLMAVNCALAQNWAQTVAPSNYWTSVVSSADGTRLAATANSVCYTSTNYGTTWASNSFPAAVNGSLMAASADGIHLVSATSNSGEIDVSTNGGFIWSKSTNYAEATWVSVVSSGDGKKLVLTEDGALVYASTNSGTTWFSLVRLPNSGSAEQHAVLSADGNFLGVAVQVNFFTTTNFGINWVTNSPLTPFGEIAASADGEELVTAPYGNYIYTSTNFGATWIEQTNSPDLLWWSCASSADGTKLAAVSGTAGGSGVIYTSTNAGMTWASNSVPDQQWAEVVSSADGNRLFALVNGNDPVTAGGIWTLDTAPAPQLNFSISNGMMNFSWLVPSTNFVLQQNPALDAADWIAITNLPTLNTASLQEQVFLPSTSQSGFFRLAALVRR